METAKVDIRKLQLLNDRIAQTIDALNQVRLSVHGLQTAAVPGYGSGVQQGLSHTPWMMGQPYGQVSSPFGLGVQGQQFPQQWGQQLGYAFPQQTGLGGIGQPGLSHTGLESAAYADPITFARVVNQTFPFSRSEISPYVGM